jgi:hypothetical protein
MSRTLSSRERDYCLTFLGRNYICREKIADLLDEQLRLAVRGNWLVIFVHKHEIHVDLAPTLDPGNLGVTFQKPELLGGISLRFVIL